MKIIEARRNPYSFTKENLVKIHTDIITHDEMMYFIFEKQ